MESTKLAELQRLADQVLEVPELEDVVRLLSHDLPRVLELPSASFMLWNRQLDEFEGLPPGETQLQSFRPGADEMPTPPARYLVADGTLLELPRRTGDAILVPLLARSGLVGMLALMPKPERRRPFPATVARLLSKLADRAALAVENALYHRELAASERVTALGTMTEMLAHDFRNPLTIIRGYAESLLDPDVPPEVVRSHAELIMSTVDRLERMTSETLDFARIGGRLIQRPVRLPAFLQRLSHDMRESLPGLEIVNDIDVPDVAVFVDEAKLGRALDNLAANARDAMGGAGRLHFSARVEPPERTAQGNRLVLLVEDNGPGVVEAIRARLFDPFVTHGKKRGTGLGLTVARHFIEDHGGMIALLPSEAGRPSGARFRIVIPLTMPEPAEDEP